MPRKVNQTSPFGDDTMANLPVDYSFRDYRRQQAEAEARRQAEAQAVALAAAQAVEEDEEMSDEESLEAIRSFMAEEEEERKSEERVNRFANGILTRIAGQPTEEAPQQRTISQRPYETSQQYVPPALDEEEPEPRYAPLWLYWAIGVTACLVMLALIYIVSR